MEILIMAENINPSQYYTPETLRRLGNLAKGIYNYYGNEVANPGNYQTNFNDLQRATGVVRDLQTLKPSYWRTGNAPFYGDLTVLPTKNNPRYVPVDGVYKNPVYFDGSYVPDLAQFYELTEGPRVNIWGPSTPRVNQARNPQY